MILHYFKQKENTEKKLAYNLYNKILSDSNLLLNQNNFFKEKNYKTSFEIVSIFIIVNIKRNIQFKKYNYIKCILLNHLFLYLKIIHQKQK